MKIAILLPYKENFSNINTGAVSIFVNDTNNLSQFKHNIKVYGSTTHKHNFPNYSNIKLNKKFLQSTSKIYVNKFLEEIKNKHYDIIEIHNRPNYLEHLSSLTHVKKILFFHNNPLEMLGSKSTFDRINLLKTTDHIVFNSNFIKRCFLKDIDIKESISKLSVVPQSTSKTKVIFKNKKKLISFVGKLNESKGYDIFGNAVVNILNKYKNWNAIVIGTESRQKYFFRHKRLKHYLFKPNKFILNKLKDVSISVIPSRWDEPFGRSSLEASSRGCAIIRSNKGGLKETTKFSLNLIKLTHEELYKKIEFLINNSNYRTKLQKLNYRNFKFTNDYSSKKIDQLRNKIFGKKKSVDLKKNLKILHITNFNERFNARLHYNTGKRINNALIRLGHNVYQLSDRDIISSNRRIFDFKSEKTLNNKIIDIFNNFNPDIILMGHADLIKYETLVYLKQINNNIKIAQWFLDPLSKYGPDYHNNKNRILKNNDIIDSTFLTTDPSALDFKIKNSFYIPNPVDKSFETLQNFKNTKKNDLFFAMSHGVHRGNLKKGKSDNREIFLNNLSQNKKIICDFYGINNKQPIWAEDFIKKISESNMGLNLSRGKPIKYYSSDRIAQLMGNGLLTFIHQDCQFSDFFNNKEIITYKNLKDLVNKILFYKENPTQRKLIARNGYKKYHKEFSSDKVAKYIISKITNLYSKEKFYWVR